VIQAKALLGVVGLAATVPEGVVHFLGGVAEVCWHLPRLIGVGCCLWEKSSIRSMDQHDGDVLDFVSLLGALCLKTRLGGPMLLSSSVRRCPRLLFWGAMHSRVSQDRPSPAIFLFRWCIDKESSFIVVVLWRHEALVEMRLCSLVYDGCFLVVFVLFVVAIFG
jgi:hypothetical protein